MKFLESVLALALAAVAVARVDIEFDNTKVKPGKTYEIEWESDTDYALNLLLVRGFPDEDEGWNEVKNVFSELDSKAGHGTYNWTVPSNLEPGDKYALWLQGTEKETNRGYATITEWFSITKPRSHHHCAKKILRNFVSFHIPIRAIIGVAFLSGLAAFAIRRRRARAHNAAVRSLNLDVTAEKMPQYVQIVGV